MALAISDSVTQWSFSCLTDGGGTKPPAGGLVLQQVQHHGHNFARDIRVIGFWVEIETVSPAGAVTAIDRKFYILDDTNFTVAPIAQFAPAAAGSPGVAKTFPYLKQLEVAINFDEYFKDAGNYFAYIVKAEYTAAGFFNKFPNCELAGLNVTQSFLFSPYGNLPAHEPTGVLNAARCHPIVRYETTVNRAVDKTKPYSRLKAIRFDYRLHLYIDRHHDKPTNATLGQIGNQAGLFADEDYGDLGLVAGGISGLVRWRRPATRAIFESAEKPVMFEVTTGGLETGLPEFMPTPTAKTPSRYWDNIHWWGARGKEEPLISAPGGFHAAHIHWRWGKPAAEEAKGKPGQFGKPPLAGKRWGPLVDPKIWMQSIRIAVVKNDPKLDPSKGVPPAKLSSEDFYKLFNSLRAEPDDISAGDDIVLWYSVEIPSEVKIPGATAPLTPTTPASLFLSGIFFAHGPEQTAFKIGSTKPEYFPTEENALRTPPAKWYRLAK